MKVKSFGLHGNKEGYCIHILEIFKVFPLMPMREIVETTIETTVVLSLMSNLLLRHVPT
jgi:hypothetical protein